MEKFKGKYRIPSARWSAWNYGDNAAYFVTICTKTRSHDFGEIVNGEMQLALLGQAAGDCWVTIPDHFPFVILGAFVVMPNHVHGVIIIAKSEPVVATLETQNFASLQQPSSPSPPQNKFGPQSQNLASIVRGYKIGVTKFSKEQNISFTWQPRYHDRIIRNEAEYGRIEQYIHANPQNWADDSLYTPS